LVNKFKVGESWEMGFEEVSLLISPPLAVLSPHFAEGKVDADKVR